MSKGSLLEQVPEENRDGTTKASSPNLLRFAKPRQGFRHLVYIRDTHHGPNPIQLHW